MKYKTQQDTKFCEKNIFISLLRIIIYNTRALALLSSSYQEVRTSVVIVDYKLFSHSSGKLFVFLPRMHFWFLKLLQATLLYHHIHN